MLSKTNAFLVAMTLCVVGAAATYQALAAPVQTQSFFFRVVTKNTNPEVSHTIGVVATSQAAAEDMALDYAQNTFGGSGWYVGGTTTNYGEVHVNSFAN